MDANIVFSIGKTASTSIFTSWAKVERFPVFHTHNLIWFCVVDKKDSEYMKHIEKYDCYCERSPGYLPDGYMENRFKLSEEFTMEDAFPKRFFNRMNFIGLVRDPKARRISQFLDNLTLESVNAHCDAVKMGFTVDENNIVEGLKRIHHWKGKSDHNMLLKFSEIAFEEDRLLDTKDVFAFFCRYFSKCELPEYLKFSQRLFDYTGVNVDPKCIKETGFFKQTNGRMNVLILKMENLQELSTELFEFTGVRELGHDRKICKEKFIIDGKISEFRKYLVDTPVQLYPDSSDEKKFVTDLGY